MVCYAILKEVDVEGQLAAVLVNVGNLKAFFRCSISQIRMRISVRTESGASGCMTEMGVVKVTILYVAATIGTENPILVGNSDVVEEGIGKHSVIVERDRVVPTRHDESGARNTFVKEVLFVTVF